VQHFTIRDIENLTGIKAHTWRIWEQRYGMFAPKHQEHKHRTYDNDDLKKILRIAFLYHRGMKVSKIATLSDEEMLREVQATEMGIANYPLYTLQLVEASVDFDKHQFSQIIDDAIEVMGFEKCIAELCYPFLTKIGMLWVTNHVIPAQEHFASYIIQNKIIARTEAIATPDYEAPAIVLFTPAGEHHELPLLFINYLLRKHGWNSIYLGSSISINTLQQLKLTKDIASFYTHIITNLTGLIIDDYFEALCQAFPGKRIIASGAAVTGMQRKFVNVTVLASDDAIYRFIRNNPYLGST
jgi:DNA-binding transcriptional MerR regulator